MGRRHDNPRSIISNRYLKKGLSFWRLTLEISHQTKELREEVSGIGYLDKTLEHFGISNKESMVGCLGRCDNSAFFRKNMGIDWIFERHKDDGINLEEKVRIIIDYDKNFPKILIRVIPQK